MSKSTVNQHTATQGLVGGGDKCLVSVRRLECIIWYYSQHIQEIVLALTCIIQDMQ